MSDMLRTIQPKSDQLNADDLIGGARSIRVTRVEVSNRPDQPVSIFYEGDNGRPWKPCKTMRRVLIEAWGASSSEYVGRVISLYRDEKVSWAGEEIGGIRIAGLSHIDHDMVVLTTEKKAKRVKRKIRALRMAESIEVEEKSQRADSPSEHEPQNDALDFDHEAAAAMLEAEYAATRTFLGLRDIWDETKADRQAIMARDPEYKAKFAAMLDREKARLAG